MWPNGPKVPQKRAKYNPSHLAMLAHTFFPAGSTQTRNGADFSDICLKFFAFWPVWWKEKNTKNKKFSEVRP
jgi:hypothetical protein